MTTLHQAQAALQGMVSAALAGIVTGTRETITLGGQATPLDIVTLGLICAGIPGSPVSISYTVKANDALANIVQGLARALNANPGCRAAGLSAIASSSTPNVFVFYPGNLTVAWSFGLSVGATETVALANQLIGPDVAIGWPPIGRLQEVARGGAPAVAIYDRRVGKDLMRWNPYAYNQQQNPSGLTTALSPASGMLSSIGATATITLGGGPKAGDAVSCVISNRAISQTGLHQVNIGQTAAQVVSALQTDTPSTIATRLAAAINGDAVLGTWVTATPAGAAVTLTSLVSSALTVQTYAGNGGSQQRELIRKLRQFQVVTWARTELQRQTLVDPIDAVIALAQATFSGLADASGNPVRVVEVNDFDVEDDTLEDVFRHDFLVTLEYAVTTTDQLYAVLAPVQAFQVAD